MYSFILDWSPGMKREGWDKTRRVRWNEKGDAPPIVCSLVDSRSSLRPHAGSLFLCCHTPLVFIVANPATSKCHLLSCLLPFQSQVASLFLPSFKFLHGFLFYFGGGVWLKMMHNRHKHDFFEFIEFFPEKPELSEKKLTRRCASRFAEQQHDTCVLF